MTLSKNYSTHSNDMYMCTINNYISLFTILKSFPDIPEWTEILMSETINVMTDIKRYVDYMFEGATAILQENTCYKNALFECGNYLVNCMNIETIHILKPAIRVAN